MISVCMPCNSATRPLQAGGRCTAPVLSYFLVGVLALMNSGQDFDHHRQASVHVGLLG